MASPRSRQPSHRQPHLLPAMVEKQPQAASTSDVLDDPRIHAFALAQWEAFVASALPAARRNEVARHTTLVSLLLFADQEGLDLEPLLSTEFAHMRLRA